LAGRSTSQVARWFQERLQHLHLAHGRLHASAVDQLPTSKVLTEIDNTVDLEAMEHHLMREGVATFAEPQQAR
jgi:hypothetical protein